MFLLHVCSCIATTRLNDSHWLESKSFFPNGRGSLAWRCHVGDHSRMTPRTSLNHLF